MSEKLDFTALRQSMVENQLASRGIRDPATLAAFRRVPRERFAPAERAACAYDDHPLPIGLGQTISQPYMVALMTQELRLRAGMRVLEIGTGSGYQTAILAEMGGRVYTIERLEPLLTRARHALESLGHENIQFRLGDGSLGWPEQAPFDRIIVTAGAPRVPPALQEQLADQGVLVIPVGHSLSQELRVITRNGDRFESRDAGGCVFVPLVGKDAWPEDRGED